MSNYKIKFSKGSVKDIKKLPKTTVERILYKIFSLAANPTPPGCRKLAGTENSWRVRVGNYRILYTVENDILLIEIIKIRHRKDVYD